MAITNHMNNVTTHRSVWATFAAWMLLISGFFQIIAGLVAIVQPELYVATESQLFVLNYNQWGWITVLWGIIMATAGSSLLAGKMWGRVVAVTLATISALINLALIWAYPVWSLLVIFIDIMIIFSVVMHNSKEEND